MQNIFLTAMKRFQLCLIDTHVYVIDVLYFLEILLIIGIKNVLIKE